MRAQKDQNVKTAGDQIGPKSTASLALAVMMEKKLLEAGSKKQ